MNVLEAIETRRSVRKYKPKSMPEEDLKTIIKAAQLAPSAGNKQPWRLIVVTEPDMKKKVAEVDRKQMMMADASVIIACLGMDKKSPEVYERWAERDVMTAVEHMVLASRELGYGTCWIGAFVESDVRELLGIPEEMTVVNLLTIGVPDQKPEAKPRKPITELFHDGKYGKPLSI